MTSSELSILLTFKKNYLSYLPTTTLLIPLSWWLSASIITLLLLSVVWLLSCFFVEMLTLYLDSANFHLYWQLKMDSCMCACMCVYCVCMYVLCILSVFLGFASKNSRQHNLKTLEKKITSVLDMHRCSHDITPWTAGYNICLHTCLVIGVMSHLEMGQRMQKGVCRS